MKRRLFLLPLLLVLGCKDQIIDPKTEVEETTVPSLCKPDFYPEPPSASFAGAKSAESVSSNRFKVRWEKHPEAKGYLIYMAKAQEELKLYKVADKEQSWAWINGLEPQTDYQAAVKLLDERGLYDANENTVQAATTNEPAYINQKSLYFDGFAGAALGPSKDVLPSRGFTVSLWFKTSHRQQGSSARLLTFHQGLSAGSALSLGVKRDKVFLRYRNEQRKPMELSHNQAYYDDAWHHLAAAYNGRFISLYLDGNKVVSELEDFIGFGDHPASLGSYTGIQKGFTGLVDELSLWTSAMSSMKIRDIYNQGRSDNLLAHARSNSLNVWLRLGDDHRDQADHLQDQMDFAHGVPVNIENGDFTADAP